MILLDTNVLSALMRREPDPVVLEWLDAQPAESVWISAITVFEVRLGLELLAAGRKRRQLEDAFSRALAATFEGRVLPFDEAAADASGRLGAKRRRSGRTVEIRDLQIAGITLAARASLATRNTRHFEDLEIPLLDPWSG